MKDLHIVVCLRQVPDTNGCRADFVVDMKTKKIALSGIPPVINPFDENALEAALRLKETHGGKVTAIAVGEFLSKAIMMKALAVGADDLILYEDKGFSGMDSLSIARALSHAIKQIGEFSIIMTGLQTSDWGFGLLGAGLAHVLNIPFIGMAQKVSVDPGDTHVVVKRATRNGHQVVKAAMPAVITTDSLVGELRYPSLKALVLAKKRPIDKWNFGNFEIDAMGAGMEGFLSSEARG
jgi:electron transfer flavoprotein beta subunit